MAGGTEGPSVLAKSGDVVAVGVVDTNVEIKRSFCRVPPVGPSNRFRELVSMALSRSTAKYSQPM
jgi:hypothetical protein